MAFSRSRTEHPVLCSCAEAAVNNYIRLRLTDLRPLMYTDRLRVAPLDSLHFPEAIAIASLGEEADPIWSIGFESRICHRCNLATPRLRYCHPMYGGAFKQAFGWYINQAFFRSGINPTDKRYLPDVCPTEIQQLIRRQRKIARRKLIQALQALSAESYDPKEEPWRIKPEVLQRQLAQALQDELDDTTINDLDDLRDDGGKIGRKIWNVFENETRREFGMKNIGDAWVSEGILFQIVSKMFKEHECIRHFHPPWLEGLELDIFIPSQGIAFEYQGQQHFHPIKHWGGRKALDQLINRDNRKADLCRQQGISLITIDYTEPLTEQHLYSRIDERG